MLVFDALGHCVEYPDMHRDEEQRILSNQKWLRENWRASIPWPGDSWRKLDK